MVTQNDIVKLLVLLLVGITVNTQFVAAAQERTLQI